MLEFRNPIPVVVENDRDGYAIYVTNEPVPSVSRLRTMVLLVAVL
jgi:hypothetical protein